MKDSFWPVGLPDSGEVNTDKLLKKVELQKWPGMRYDFLVEDALKKLKSKLQKQLSLHMTL
jgi:hypothetical protein